MIVGNLEQVLHKLEIGFCDLCSRTTRFDMEVDHNHSTGMIRGVLCKPHNIQVWLTEQYGDTFGSSAITWYLSQPDSHIPYKTYTKKLVVLAVRKWKKENPDLVREQRRRWRKRHYDEWLVRNRLAQRRHKAKLKTQKLDGKR